MNETGMQQYKEARVATAQFARPKTGMVCGDVLHGSLDTRGRIWGGGGYQRCPPAFPRCFHVSPFMGFIYFNTFPSHSQTKLKAGLHQINKNANHNEIQLKDYIKA